MGNAIKANLFTGTSFVRDLYFLACSSKTYCRGNTYIAHSSLGFHDIAMVQQEHKYWPLVYQSSFWKPVKNWKLSVTFLSLSGYLSPLPLIYCRLLRNTSSQNCSWGWESSYRQFLSPCLWNLFADHKCFPVAFSVALHFYRGHYNCR